jgi:hypothetical protein
VSEPTRIYDDAEMTILRAALNLLREGHYRTINAVHGETASGDTWQWITWAGLTMTAADNLNSVVFRHDRFTEDVPEPQAYRAKTLPVETTAVRTCDCGTDMWLEAGLVVDVNGPHTCPSAPQSLRA